MDPDWAHCDDSEGDGREIAVDYCTLPVKSQSDDSSKN